MRRVNIYIEIGSRAPKVSKKKFGYVMECVNRGEKVAKAWEGECVGTYHKAVLWAIKTSMKRLNQNCTVTLYIQDSFVKNMAENNLEEWAQNGFLTARGMAVVNKEEWAEIYRYYKQHKIEIVTGKHAYSGLIKEKIKEGNNV